MSEFWVSPKYKGSDFKWPLSLDDKITIHEDSGQGWFLDVGKSLESNVAADFVTLMIISSFFEGHAMYLRGRKARQAESGGFFRIWFL